jgi:hypothetical protein
VNRQRCSKSQPSYPEAPVESLSIHCLRFKHVSRHWQKRAMLIRLALGVCGIGDVNESSQNPLLNAFFSPVSWINQAYRIQVITAARISAGLRYNERAFSG